MSHSDIDRHNASVMNFTVYRVYPCGGMDPIRSFDTREVAEDYATECQRGYTDIGLPCTTDIHKETDR